MSPNTPQFIITNILIPAHPQRIGHLPLLLNRKQNIALNPQNQCGDLRKGFQALCEVVEMWRWVDGWWMRFGVRGFVREDAFDYGVWVEFGGCRIRRAQSEFFKSRGCHVEEIHGFRDVEQRVGIVLEAELFTLRSSSKHVKKGFAGKRMDPTHLVIEVGLDEEIWT
jgi:hypothetical protein